MLRATGFHEEEVPICYGCMKPLGREPFHVHPDEGSIHERCCGPEDVPLSLDHMAGIRSAPRNALFGVRHDPQG